MVIASILWRRLDEPGHDACRLERLDQRDGWRVDGAAAFSQDGQPAHLAYRVSCDREWRCTSGMVKGWIGSHAIDLTIERSAAGIWMMNGALVPGVDSLVDLDLGFTPATNLFQMRRLGLAVTQSAQQSVVWLDPGSRTFDTLEQRYERRSDHTYWYEAPRFTYAALLEMTSAGFIDHYPGLWKRERDERGISDCRFEI